MRLLDRDGPRRLAKVAREYVETSVVKEPSTKEPST